MFGKLSWAAIPFDQPIPLIAGGGGAGRDLRGARLDRRQGASALSLARMDHQRRSQADRRDVHLARHGDAAARLRRRHHDAGAAGDRVSFARLSAAGALQPDLLGARHDHDLLRGDAVRDRVDESRGAAATRRPRRGVSDPEFGRLLADRDRRFARQHLAGGRRVRAHRLAALSAAVGADLFARRRRRLLSVGAADFRRRHAGRRHQSGHHGAEAAHQGHELSAHADVLLDHAGLESADRGGVPDPDRDARDADPRPLSRLPFLHQRSRRQHDDVHEPDLGLGTSRGLHPRPAGVRRFLGSGLDLLRQAAVRLPVDGARHHGDLRHLVHGLAAPLLHHGRRRPTSTRSSASPA